MSSEHHIEGYEIHSKKLGEGGFGVVRLATHKLTEQKVAIKIIDKKKLSKDLHRIKNEITALSNLYHENIVKLLQYYENHDYIYMIMEYCSGGELFDYLLTKRLDEFECKKIFISLINILKYIHSKGIAHRDIKPENILFDTNMNIKLIDFGLCACSYIDAYATLDSLSTPCGSPAYVAPELLQGNPYSGPPVDVWSTGVLLYVLLTGRLPFDSNNLAKLYAAIKEGRYPMPSYIKSDIKDLLKRMLCVNPSNRITVEEILKHKWLNLSTNNKHSPANNNEYMDEKILLKCLVKFPNLKLNDLRELIMDKLGYHRATYLLIKQKPELYPDFDSNLIQKNLQNRRRSRSFNNLDTIPVLKRIANDNNNNNNTEYDIKDSSTKTVDHSIKSNDLIENSIEEINSGKQSIVAAIATPNGRIAANGIVNKPTMPKPLQAPATVNVNRFGAKQQNHRTPQQPLTSKQLEKTNVNRVVNRNLFNDNSIEKRLNSNSKDKCNNSHNNSNSNVNTPTKFKRSNENHQNYQRLIMNGLNNKENIPLNSNNNNNNNPISTPKKTLLKWFKDISSPRQLNQPKRMSLIKMRQSQTIFATNFFDAPKCRDYIIKFLTEKQVNCQDKNFTIRCVMSAGNLIIIAFELELFICIDDNKRVLLQHKRIRGTSWDYFNLMKKLQHQLTNESKLI